MKNVKMAAYEMFLKDFVQEHDVPDYDRIRLVRPTCNDEGEVLSTETVYEGTLSHADEYGELVVNECNSDFDRNRDGVWEIWLQDVYAA